MATFQHLIGYLFIFLLSLKENERSESPEEPVGCPKTHASSIYTSAGSVPVWIKQSSTPEIEDHELARKKRQLEELSECIARKRAIMAMELKAKTICDGSEIKKKYDFGSCSDDLDITMTNKHTWQFDIKPDLQPKKSILKKRSESVTDQPQVCLVPLMVICVDLGRMHGYRHLKLLCLFLASSCQGTM